MYTDKVFEIFSIFPDFQATIWISFSITKLDHENTS